MIGIYINLHRKHYLVILLDFLSNSELQGLHNYYDNIE